VHQMIQSTTADNHTARACRLSALVSIKVVDTQWNCQTGEHVMLLRQLRELEASTETINDLLLLGNI